MSRGKNGNGEGSIYQIARTKRWCGAVSLGYVNGKQLRKYIYGKTRKEVADEMVKVKRQLQQGIAISTQRRTVGAFLTHWLEHSAKATVRDSTYRSYLAHANNHILPTLGRIPLEKLTPEDVERMMNQKIREGLSPRTVQYLRAILRRALSQQVKRGTILRNAAALAESPKVEQHQISPLTPEEARTFLRAIRDDPREALYVTAIATGLRQGELLGLTWTDIDFGGRTLTVRRQLQRIGGKLTFTETKTERSRRTLELPALVIEALHRQEMRRDEMRELAGTRWNDTNLVFTTKLGTPLDASNVTHYFQQALAKAGMRRQRFHDLRHCAASLLLSQGKDLRTVMDMLGHSTITLAANTYGHLTSATRREAAAAMDAVLSN